VAPGSSPATPAGTPRRRRLSLGLVAIAIGVCLVGVLCGVLFGSALIKSVTERPRVERLLDEFMSAMVRGDASAAYSLFSARARRQVPLLEIERMLEGNNYVLFEGYERLTVANMQVEVAVNTDPNVPQGTVANVEAVIEYEGGFTGSMQALLEQEQSEWRLDRVNVTVPPDKLGAW
jgi:hypothetical protein